MKTIKQLGLSLAMALAIVLSSCSSDGGSGGGGGTAALGTLKAKINGTQFTSMTQATTAVDAFNGTYHNFSITGADATGKSMIIMLLVPNVANGTYPIGDESGTLVNSIAYNEVNLSTFESQSWAAPFDGGSNFGSVVITSKTDTNIQGTFTANIGNPETGTSRSVTNGAFNINITAGN